LFFQGRATVRIATWNVNSLRVRLPQLLDWLGSSNPDVVALQETKSPDEKFPFAELAAAGYHSTFSGQKTYNGVALLARSAPSDPVTDIPNHTDPQRRVLAASYGALRVIDLYVPNGQTVGSEKYQYKLRWLAALEPWLAAQLARHPQLVVLGDFNIAPEDRDVHDPKAWEGQNLVSPEERAEFVRLIELGLVDAFRQFEQPEKIYSWWDYRMMAFRRNAGMRIDHILLSQALAEVCSSCDVDKVPRKWEQPSDHAPVVAQIG
jgi:exodeoxyribonuclease III